MYKLYPPIHDDRGILLLHFGGTAGRSGPGKYSLFVDCLSEKSRVEVTLAESLCGSCYSYMTKRGEGQNRAVHARLKLRQLTHVVCRLESDFTSQIFWYSC